MNRSRILIKWVQDELSVQEVIAQLELPLLVEFEESHDRDEVIKVLWILCEYVQVYPFSHS